METAPEMPAAEQKKWRPVHTLLVLLVAFIVAVNLLAIGVFSRNWKRTVKDYPIKLMVGLEEQEGTYTGILRRRLPNGAGAFTFQYEEEDRILEGEFLNGLVQGDGTLRFASIVYQGSFVNSMSDGYGTYLYEDVVVYEGVFRDGFAENSEDFYAALALYSEYGVESEYDDAWRKTVQEHSELFPADTADEVAELEWLWRTDVTYAQLIKNPKKYQSEFLQYSGIISQIWERDDNTFLTVADLQLNVFCLVYLGEIEYVKGDWVDFVATPIQIRYYENLKDETVESVLMLASRVYQ